MAISDSTDSILEIQLTRGYVAIVDEADIDIALKHTWYANINAKGRVVAHARYNEKGVKGSYYLHRAIMERLLGRKLNRTEYVDHIDRNALNNRRSNLRIATNSQNQANTDRWATNTTGRKGVSFNTFKQLYKAHIRVNGKGIHLGYFADPDEAHRAYIEAAKKYFGEFASGV